ncbi:MAG: diguanylate phosphodiesterase [Rhizobium sp.]|nr:MAG: diguanylate phosphodiesterase [Rhizobium sp.]
MNVSCAGCRDGKAFHNPFSMAFQPIVDVERRQVFAHEALVRGPAGEGAGSVLSAVDEGNRYAFDQQCRVKAIELASRLDLTASDARLSINFMPNAVYEPRACIRATLAACKTFDLPAERIIFEFTEGEALDVAHLENILKTYREIGFMTAIDDFGAGHSGLNLLAKMQPDIVKIDMDLIRGIDTDRAKQVILKHLVAMLGELTVTVVCEGIETEEELKAVRDTGVTLIQGYRLAKPSFERLTPLAEIALPD